MAAEVPNLDIATIRLGGPVARGPGRCPRCRGHGCEPRPRRWPVCCWRRSRCWSRRPSPARAAEEPLYVPWSSALPGWTEEFVPTSENDCVAGRDSCLRTTLKELGRVFEETARSCSHNAVFSLAYLRITQTYGWSRDLPGYYQDVPFANHQDAVFARYYTDAYTQLARRRPRRRAAVLAAGLRRRPRPSCQRHRRPAAGHERPHQPRPALRGGRGRAGRPGRLLAQARLRQGRGLPQPGHRGDAGRGGAAVRPHAGRRRATRSGSATWPRSR